MCADDFNRLVQICDGDKCLGVNADPSHCWEGESWETRFLKVAPRIYACHVKNFVIRQNFPLRMMESGWQKRAMQFVDIGTGDLNMTRYAELMMHSGYPQRYCTAMGATAPLVVEAESAYRDLDTTSANGIAYVRDNLCFPIAAGSFEEGMGGLISPPLDDRRQKSRGPPATVLQTFISNDLGCKRDATFGLFCSMCSTRSSPSVRLWPPAGGNG